MHPPVVGSDPLGTARKARTGPSSPAEPSGSRRGAGAAGRGHHLLQGKRRGAGDRKDAAPPHTCGSLPRAPTRLGRPSSAALGRCDAAPCPKAALGEAALLPDPVQTASPVPGPGMSRAGGGCAEQGERSGAHRRLVIRPDRRTAPAGATREMLAGAGDAWGSSRRGSRRRCRRARPDCGLGLPQSGSLKGPRPLGLGWRPPRLRPQARVGGARRTRVGPPSPRWNLNVAGARSRELRRWGCDGIPRAHPRPGCSECAVRGLS